MKIKLTATQKASINAIFENINKLSADEKFMQMLSYNDNNYDENNEDSRMLINFIEEVIDSMKCNFNYYNSEE